MESLINSFCNVLDLNDEYSNVTISKEHEKAAENLIDSFCNALLLNDEQYSSFTISKEHEKLAVEKLSLPVLKDDQVLVQQPKKSGEEGKFKPFMGVGRRLGWNRVNNGRKRKLEEVVVKNNSLKKKARNEEQRKFRLLFVEEGNIDERLVSAPAKDVRRSSTNTTLVQNDMAKGFAIASNCSTKKVKLAFGSLSSGMVENNSLSSDHTTMVFKDDTKGKLMKEEEKTFQPFSGKFYRLSD